MSGLAIFQDPSIIFDAGACGFKDLEAECKVWFLCLIQFLDNPGHCLGCSWCKWVQVLDPLDKLMISGKITHLRPFILKVLKHCLLGLISVSYRFIMESGKFGSGGWPGGDISSPPRDLRRTGPSAQRVVRRLPLPNG